MSLDKWVVHTYHRILLMNKKERTTDTHHNMMNLLRIMLSEKKLIPKVYILNDPIYITLLKWQNNLNGHVYRASQWLPGDSEGGRVKWVWHGNVRDFCGDENIVYLDCIIVIILKYKWMNKLMNNLKMK